MIDQIPVSGCPHGELATGWALHALEPAEESMVSAHLADCEDCTRTVSDTEHVCAALGLSLPESTPSPALEQRILAIANTIQVSPVAAVTAPAVTGLPSPATVQRRPPGHRTRCVPETVTVLSILLILLVLAVIVVFYLV